VTLACIGSKLAVLVVRDLLNGTKRFTDLQKSLDVYPKALVFHLRSMEEQGLVQRGAYSGYSLTELGYSLEPILDAMKQWGEEKKAMMVE